MEIEHISKTDRKSIAGPGGSPVTISGFNISNVKITVMVREGDWRMVGEIKDGEITNMWSSDPKNTELVRKGKMMIAAVWMNSFDKEISCSCLVTDDSGCIPNTMLVDYIIKNASKKLKSESDKMIKKAFSTSK